MISESVRRAAGGLGPDPSSVESDRLIQHALLVYERIFRAGVLHPTGRQLERYAAGARAMESRRLATPWLVPTEAQREARFVLHAFQSADDVALDEWIDLFPAALLSTLDRRRPSGRDLGPLMRRVVALHVCGSSPPMPDP